MQGKTPVPVLISSTVAFSALVLSIVAETTREWMTITESGSERRVPWVRNTTIGLWKTCYYYVSGFPREEVYTSGCFPTSEFVSISKHVTQFCQASLTTSMILLPAAILLAGFSLFQKTERKRLVLVLCSATVFTSGVLGTLALSLFQPLCTGDAKIKWSYYLGIMAPILCFPSAFGFLISSRIFVNSTNKINTTPKDTVKT